MSEYKFELDPDSFHTDMTCFICKDLMIDSCHSTCGCQYCYKCISVYIGNEDKYCPGNNTNGKEDFFCIDRDVIRDTKMNKRIFKSRVMCPNGSCGYKTQLIEIQEHLRLCKKQSMTCRGYISECDNADKTMNEILNLLQTEKVRATQLLLGYIYNMKNEFNELKSTLSTNQLDIQYYREDSKLKERQIVELNHTFEVQKKDLADQRIDLANQKKYLEDQKKDLVKQKKDLEDQKKHLADQRIDMTDQKNDLADQKKDLVEQKKDLADQKNDLADQKKDLADQKKDLADQRKDVADQKNDLVKQKKDLEDQKKHLADQSKGVADQKKDLVVQKKDLEDQKKDLMDQKKDLTNQKKDLVDLRKEFEKVKEECVKKSIGMATLERELRNEMKCNLSTTTEKTEKIKRATEDQTRGINIMKDYLMGAISDFRGEMERISGRDLKMINLIQLCPNIDGDFVWRIYGISGKMKSMQYKRIYSESFYSNNYKFSLYICITGDIIMLCCMIMPGDHDKEVNWPLPLTVTLAIINQGTLRTQENWKFKYDPYDQRKSAFDRPWGKPNDYGIGPAWINYSSIIGYGSVVVGDSVIVSCVIGDK